MSNLEKETMEIFKELSPENQANLLMYARLAYTAECSVKKSLERQREKEEKNP
ncbi:hypothetical protein AGMMS50276_06040 [Synergistales bacterium]|nr:hypothetical protein AGMMS50276_06040 [Synergistales bacterium]